jgi:hypothetical protein
MLGNCSLRWLLTLAANRATASTLEFLASLSGFVGWRLLGLALCCDCLHPLLGEIAFGFILFLCCISLQPECCRIEID